MKDLFKVYYDIAEYLECPAVVREKEILAKKITESDKTVVVVTGMRSSGKTVVINEMVGYEVREPGNRDENEKPLRVSFEPIEKDDRYECILVVDHEWNELDAVIYEFREEQMLADGSLTENAWMSDKVFFVISATAPFNIDEINFLKALGNVNCQIIVNGISIVKEQDRSKVKEYISKINTSLGLPTPLYLEDGVNFSKMVRSSLPAYDELKENRSHKLTVLTGELETLLENELESRKNAYDERKNDPRDALNSRRLISNCQTLQLDALEYCNKAKKKAINGLNESLPSMIDSVLKDSNLNDLDEIEQCARKKFNQKTLKAIKLVRDSYFSAVNTIESSASILGLPGWDKELAENLKTVFPNISGIPVECNPVIGSVGKKSDSAVMTESSKILLGTGLIAGGFAIAPLPTLVSISGAIASTGVGGSMFLKKRYEEKEHDLRIALKTAFSEGEAQVKQLISETADTCYGRIVSALKNSESIVAQSHHNDHDTENENRKNKLDEAARLLKYIKENGQKEN